ncbi:alpha/beta fold hydrolase [Rarobacter incanus]|uniref:Pimeloyl-ACP methyl ester carboxylesterase n=1 Tax=Rarobacter incanus TaxID=153494 RepID=A0A542SP86_9MICO|nr:alpha/beta hydrolase [Rarobacter incanus]TQK76433.1 pimeloyl-ACP methyl ester carboxylesterase [Rarobacter incanus]
MPADYSEILLDGPWTHRNVAANGSRFHVADGGDEDTRAVPVILLHSFPQMWWTWRHQLAALASAGYRPIAVDLRGYGASDKPPLGYDIPNICRDVSGVIRALGLREAVIIGHGLGGVVAWSMPTVVPAVTTAVAAISAPHPARIHASDRGVHSRTVRHKIVSLRLPGVAEHQLAHTDMVARILKFGAVMPWTTQALNTYRTAMRLPSVPRTSLEPLRWLTNHRVTPTYRRFLSTVRGGISVPALQLSGRFDPVFDPRWLTVDAAALCSQYRSEQIMAAGHFAHEERPDAVNEILLDWLGSLPGATR